MRINDIAWPTLLALALGGCGQDAAETAAERAIEREAGQQTSVEIDDGGLRIEAEGGALSIASGTAAEVPEGFPGDVYVYAHGDLQMAVRSPDGYTVSVSTPDTPGEVASAYAAAMDREGWSQQSQIDMGGQRMLVYEKGERIANVAVAAAGAATQVTVTVIGE